MIPFLLFCGPRGVHQIEELVDGARRAAALDLLHLVVETGLFSPVLLVSADAEIGPLPHGVQLRRTGDDGAFHFGNALHEIVAAERLPRFLYAGAGSGVFLQKSDLLALAQPLLEDTPVVVANNLYSADILGLSPSSALETVALSPDDNGLAYALWRRGGLSGHEPPRTTATQFDLDSPTDLLIAAFHPSTGKRLRAYLREASLDLARLRAAAAVFRDPTATVVVAGRVGSATWRYLEKETACRVRLLAEERGMRALGSERKARSLLGFHLEAVGPERLMAHIAELGNAAFIDTRVLLAHARVEPTREDRFLSDLGQWGQIRDPFLRDLTRAAAEAPIPVILGGQNLVSGGMMALVEAAWEEKDRS